MKIIIISDYKDFHKEFYDIISLFFNIFDLEIRDEIDKNYCLADILIYHKLEFKNNTLFCFIKCNFIDEFSKKMLKTIEIPNGKGYNSFQRSITKLCLYNCLKFIFGKPSSWGSLTGVRPSTLYRNLYNSLGNFQQVNNVLFNEYDLDYNNIQILQSIFDVQKDFISLSPQKNMSVYLHIPFCSSICNYCSFKTSVPKNEKIVDDYLDILEIEINNIVSSIDLYKYRCKSIYVGGGTPSLLNENQIIRLLKLIKTSFLDKYNFDEFSFEAGRPDTLNKCKLEILKEYGVNRISINPQTFNQETLDNINRKHGVDEIYKIYDIARELKFNCINMDLIAGLPNESLLMFINSLNSILKLAPDNITIHSLSFKKNAVFYNDYNSAINKHITDMIIEADERIKNSNYLPYYMYRQKHISSNLHNIAYSKPDKFCLYNIDMMEENSNIIGIGAVAMSKSFKNNKMIRYASPSNLLYYKENIEDIIKNKIDIFS